MIARPLIFRVKGTQVADDFDYMRRDNEKAIDDYWTSSFRSVDNLPGYHPYVIGIYSAAGLTYALNKFTTTIAAGYVDVLRIGDGVQAGGWGYGQDALRLLTLVGPAAGSIRNELGLVAAVDETSQVGNCTWIAGTRALRLTGVKHYARLGDLAKAAGMTVGETGGAYVDDLLMPLSNLGAEVRQVRNLSSITEVFEEAGRNPNGIVMFSVKWPRGGHTLLAQRIGPGMLRIIDRSGRVVSSLADLEDLYSGISQATVYGTAAVVQNAKIVTLLNTAPSLLNIFAVEVQSVGLVASPARAPIVVLKTDKQLLEGWWWVRVRQNEWIYHFQSDGIVRWRDPYNLRAGKGVWKASSDGIEISWAPASTTKERWKVPVSTSNQGGDYTDKAGTTDLTAMKFDIFGQIQSQMEGKWKVRVDKWTWIYQFDATFGVRWTDFYNLSVGGRGSWELLKDSILTTWSPASTTIEQWYLPLDAETVKGKATMGGRKLDLEAEKIVT
jgi:hypothetical protein